MNLSKENNLSEFDQIGFQELENIFLLALKLPEFARPEYFIKKQKQSSWSKGVYLRALEEVYHSYQTVYQIEKDIEKNKHNKSNVPFDEDTFGIDLKKHTKGSHEGTLTKDHLNDLFEAIRYAYRIDRPPKEFSDLQILSFCERWLIFIKDAFEQQINLANSAMALAKGLSNDHAKENTFPGYTINHYSIHSDAPVLSILNFKNSIRNLLLNSHSSEKLNSIVKPIYNYCLQIVKLWNDKLAKVELSLDEYYDSKGKVFQELIHLSFDDRSTTILYENTQMDLHRFFSNRELAGFAAGIINIIGTEVLEVAPNDQGTIQFSSLVEIFFSKEDYDKCINVLMQISPPVIGIENKYLLGPRDKGVFSAWIQALKMKSKIRQVDRITLSRLINQTFNGVNLGKDGKTLQNRHTTSFKKYYSQILQQLP